MYDKDWVKAALPLMHFRTMTVQQDKEAGMPGGTTDPRKSINPLVMMIDLRIAWDECDWLDHELRQAMLAVSMLGSSRLAAEFVYRDEQGRDISWSEYQLDRRLDRGVELLTIWMNSTHADRKAWGEELDLEAYWAEEKARGYYPPMPATV